MENNEKFHFGAINDLWNEWNFVQIYYIYSWVYLSYTDLSCRVLGFSFSSRLAAFFSLKRDFFCVLIKMNCERKWARETSVVLLATFLGYSRCHSAKLATFCVRDSSVCWACQGRQQRSGEGEGNEATAFKLIGLKYQAGSRWQGNLAASP